MALFNADDRRFAQAVTKLIYCNQLLPERIEIEKEALGAGFMDVGLPWNVHPDREATQPNLQAMLERANGVLEVARKKLLKKVKVTAAEHELYENLAIFVVYYRFIPKFKNVVRQMQHAGSGGGKRVGFYGEFVKQVMYLLDLEGVRPSGEDVLPHLFACFFQVRRAFDHIYRYIIGVSLPAVQLRAAVWQSIFTHDMQRYRQVLYKRMGDLTTLVTGPSGTGKELVSRAIGLSRYIPFDAKSQTFDAKYDDLFFALNLSALSPTLIESELFGHRWGAFTGAVGDREGWLEVCPDAGTVFLDEIGELDGLIQVKLLRVIENRSFQRIGESQVRQFGGKVVAATNRDLLAEMRAGRFREDLYYRLCSDIIVTPSLGERLRDSPQELERLVQFTAKRILGDDCERLVAETMQWIEGELGFDYPWPGNVRELEQCVRNVLIRREYHPASDGRQEDTKLSLARVLQDSGLTAEKLMSLYCTVMYKQTGNYQAAAGLLGVDRRTVRAKVDERLLDQLADGGS